MGEAADKITRPNWDDDQPASTQQDDSYVASARDDDYDDQNVEELRSEIEDTRAEMTQTINEIQERLSPDNLMQQAKETVRDATIGKVERAMDRVGETISDAAEPALEMMGRAGTTIRETGMSVAGGMRRNPIPVALIGLGLGMLMVRRFRSKGNGYSYDYDNYDTPRTTSTTRQQFDSGAARYGSNRYGSTEGTVKDTASNLANRSTEALSNLGTKAKDSASAMSTRFGRVLRENPLAIGAVAVAAGTAVGLALPTTRFEDEYVGETGERLVDKAQEVARGAIDKVQQAASQQMSPEQKPGMAPQPNPGTSPQPKPGMSPQPKPGTSPQPKPGM